MGRALSMLFYILLAAMFSAGFTYALSVKAATGTKAAIEGIAPNIRSASLDGSLKNAARMLPQKLHF